MSQYTTDEVLAMMEEWYEQHRDDGDFDPTMPFKGFDGLLGADLQQIDLGPDTIRPKAITFLGRNREVPIWAKEHPDGAVDINLAGAILSTPQKPINLSHAELSRAHLEKACLESANLCGAKMRRAKLNGAQLNGCNLRGVDLTHAELASCDLRAADLTDANIHWADLSFARLQRAYPTTSFEDANLEEANWDEGCLLGYEVDEDFQTAASYYRRMKQYYHGAGRYDIAGEFHKREMLVRRKNLWDFWKPSLVLLLLHVTVLSLALLPLKLLCEPIISIGLRWKRLRRPVQLVTALSTRADARSMRLRHQREALVLVVSELLMGYGERPSWVLGWGLLAWLGFALAFYLAQGTALGSGYGFMHFREALYYSSVAFVSFTPGGDLTGVPNWARGVGLVEALLAYFLLALFLVTFVRKTSPR